MPESVEVHWGIEDGYVSGGRSHSTVIPVEDLVNSCDTEEEVSGVLCELIQEDFEQKVMPSWEESETTKVIEAWEIAKGKVDA